MSSNPDVCDCCHEERLDTKVLRFRNHRLLRACRRCYHWARSAIARRKNIPRWLRPDPTLSGPEVTEIRKTFSSLGTSITQRAQQNRLLLEADPFGFPYQGPLDDRSWSQALSLLNIQSDASSLSRPISDAEINEQLSLLEQAGVVYFPYNPMIRRHISQLMRGDFGDSNQRLFVTVLFTWIVSEDDFIGRNPEAWAKSFQFLFEVMDDLGDRATFVHGMIEVIGSSGNIYRIKPKAGKPYYSVARFIDDRYQHVCIDPIGPGQVVFGDVLATLVLSLYDDQISARHIDTLARHVFGGPINRHRRNPNIENLWRRALGTMPQEDVEEGEPPSADAVQLRWLIDRFQTNLTDWTQGEDEDDEDSE